MTRSIFLSLVFHSAMIVITAITLPFMKREPIDLPPILSVDLIQITDKTSIPFAAKAAALASAFDFSMAHPILATFRTKFVLSFFILNLKLLAASDICMRFFQQ